MVGRIDFSGMAFCWHVGWNLVAWNSRVAGNSSQPRKWRIFWWSVATYSRRSTHPHQFSYNHCCFVQPEQGTVWPRQGRKFDLQDASERRLRGQLAPARAPWWSTSISSMLGFVDFSGLPEASNTEKLPRVMTIQELRGTPACSCRYCSCGPPPILTSWLKTKWRRGKPGPHNLLYQEMLLPADSRSALFPSCWLMLTWLHGLIWRRFLQRGPRA